MDDIKHKLPINKKIFFTNLENYLGTPLYFFGSVRRRDYSPNNSDIDAIIFTNNEASSISQLQNWFHVSKNDFKKIVNFLPKSKRMVHGYKLIYTNKKQNISSDILIYNTKDEEIIRNDDQTRTDMPFYILTIMVILKFLHYQVGILSRSMYIYFKQLIMGFLDDGVDFLKIKSYAWKFLVFDIPKKKLGESVPL